MRVLMGVALAVLMLAVGIVPAAAWSNTNASPDAGGAGVAVVTKELAQFANGQVIAQYDYNDNTQNVTRFRVINNSAHAAHLTVTQAGTVVYERDFAANSTTTLNVANIKLATVVDPDDGSVSISMGDFAFFVRWPA
jgi:hypothetical protein